MCMCSYILYVCRSTFRPCETDKGKLSDDRKAVWRTRLCAWVRKRQADEKKFPKLQTPGLANKAHMQARDHALLAGVGLPLASFKAARPQRALAAHEVLFFKDTAELPLVIRAASPGRQERACVYDKLPKQTRLLAPWSEPRRVLHCSMDQGTIGWPANYLLCFSQDLRGWMIMDPSHRRHINVHDAMRDSSLAHLKHEMTICVNLGPAPWGSCGHFFRYREAAEEYFANLTESDSLSVEMYPFLVHDLWGGQPRLSSGVLAT